MTPLFQNLLIGHVILGLLAIFFSVMVFLGLLKNIGLRKLKTFSLLGVLSFFISWILGGSYYVNFYGSSVKPVIKSGNYPWAHGIFMETKEHIFLFIPFLSLVLALAIWLLREKIQTESKLKNSAIFLSFLIVALGAAITFMGMLVSGAVK